MSKDNRRDTLSGGLYRRDSSRAMHHPPLGVGGTFHIINGAFCEVGPVQNRDAWGRVLVEILTSSHSYKGLTYSKGDVAWVNAARVDWHTKQAEEVEKVLDVIAEISTCEANHKDGTMQNIHREVAYADIIKSMASAVELSASYEDVREMLTRTGGNEDMLGDADKAKASVFSLAKEIAGMAPLNQTIDSEDLAYACGGCGKGYATKGEIEAHVADSISQEKGLKPIQRMGR